MDLAEKILILRSKEEKSDLKALTVFDLDSRVLRLVLFDLFREEKEFNHEGDGSGERAGFTHT
jgi:hypothetical protein